MARTLKETREQIACALYNNTPTPPQTPWEKIGEQAKRGWRSDAQIALGIASEYFAHIAEERDPDKPTNYLRRREDIAPAIRGILFTPDGRAVETDRRDRMTGNNDCWLDMPGCKGLCGSYGCGG